MHYCTNVGLISEHVCLFGQVFLQPVPAERLKMRGVRGNLLKALIVVLNPLQTDPDREKKTHFLKRALVLFIHRSLSHPQLNSVACLTPRN